MLLLFSNNAQTTLAGPIASNATSMNLAAGTGSEFPIPTSGLQYFVMTLNDQATKLQREIIWVTARSGDTCTILRAQEGTTARAWLSNDIAANWWTAGQAATMIQVSQLQQQATNYAVDTGAANTITITLNPQPATLASIAGSPIRVLVAHTNTGNSVLNITGLASTTVFAQGGSSTSSLPAGSIIGNQVYEFTYTAGVGFEVSTVKALLSTTNTWAQAQTEANSAFWSGNNTSGTPQALLGVDGANNTAMFAGPSGSTAWYVGNNARNATLAYLTAAGILHGAAGIVADAGSVSGPLLAAGTSGITSLAGTTNTGNGNRVPILADFGATGDPNGWVFKIPSIGLSSSNVIIVQGGIVSVPANDTPTVFSFFTPFLATCLGMVISYGAITPPVLPQIGTIGAQPANLTQFYATNTSTAGVNNGCFWIAVGF